MRPVPQPSDDQQRKEHQLAAGGTKTRSRQGTDEALQKAAPLIFSGPMYSDQEKKVIATFSSAYE